MWGFSIIKNMELTKKIIFIPTVFNVTILKLVQHNNKNIINIVNEQNEINLSVKKNNFYFDNESYCIIFYIVKNSLNTKLDNYVNKFFLSLESYFSVKIKFKGKGFKIKIYKNSKLIKFYFGKSHPTLVMIKKFNLIRVNKYKFILKGILIDKLKLLAKMIINIKPVNIYTLRGLRINRQVIKKRKGKKSSYL